MARTGRRGRMNTGLLGLGASGWTQSGHPTTKSMVAEVLIGNIRWSVTLRRNEDFKHGEKACDDCILFLAKLNSYGATKFLGDGTVQGSDGSSGTWKAFDIERHIYTVTIGGLRLSVKYLPGRGLVDPDDPEIIKFQELR